MCVNKLEDRDCETGRTAGPKSIVNQFARTDIPFHRSEDGWKVEQIAGLGQGREQTWLLQRQLKKAMARYMESGQMAANQKAFRKTTERNVCKKNKSTVSAYNTPTWGPRHFQQVTQG